MEALHKDLLEEGDVGCGAAEGRPAEEDKLLKYVRIGDADGLVEGGGSNESSFSSTCAVGGVGEGGVSTSASTFSSGMRPSSTLFPFSDMLFNLIYFHG